LTIFGVSTLIFSVEINFSEARTFLWGNHGLSLYYLNIFFTDLHKLEEWKVIINDDEDQEWIDSSEEEEDDDEDDEEEEEDDEGGSDDQYNDDEMA